MTSTDGSGERAQLAIIGIMAVIMALQLVVLLAAPLDPWLWLMVLGPMAAILTAISRLRRIRATGRPD